MALRARLYSGGHTARRVIEIDHNFYRPAQAEIFLDPARFKLIKAGRRFGKSRGAAFWLFDRGMDDGRLDLACYWVSPIIETARKIFDNFRKYFKDGIASVNISRRQIILLNGRETFFCGCDKPESIEGGGAWATVLDEVRHVRDSKVWDETLRPMLSDAESVGGGCAVLISTPRSRTHWFSVLVREVQNGQKGFDWKAWVKSTAEGGNISKKEIEEARRTLPPDIFKRNYEGIDTALSGMIYREFDPVLHVVDAFPPNCVPDSYTCGLDFGATEEHPSVFVVVGHDQRSGANAIVEECYIYNCNQEMLLKEAGRLQRAWNIRCFYCDHNRKDFVTGLRAAGMTATLAKKDVAWGIDIVRGLLFDRNGVKHYDHGPRLFFLRGKTEKIIEEIEGYCYKVGTELPDKAAGFDDAMDAMRYDLVSIADPGKYGKVEELSEEFGW